MARSPEIFTVNFLSLNFVSQGRRADRPSNPAAAWGEKIANPG